MRQDWVKTTLGEVCEMYQPKTISTREMIDEGGYPVFGANGVIGKYNKYNHEDPQLLITCRGATCGAVNISEPKSWINGNAMVVRSKDELIDLRFLEYLFRGGIDLSKSITGAAQPQITRQSLCPIEITFPKSKREQYRIVTILDKAVAAIDKAKANTEKNLQNVKELFENYLQTAFENKGIGWVQMNLGELATFRNGMNFTKSSKGEKIKIVGVKDFQDNFWVPFEELESVTINGTLNEIDALITDDIIAVRSNGNPALIGRTMLAGMVNEKVAHSGFAIRIRLNSVKIISPVYLCRFLKTQSTRRKLVEQGNGVGIKSLNQGSLSSLAIYFPKELTEQQKIVRQLDILHSKAQQLQVLYQKKIADLDEMKKSILRKAFNGELN